MSDHQGKSADIRNRQRQEAAIQARIEAEILARILHEKAEIQDRLKSFHRINDRTLSQLYKRWTPDPNDWYKVGADNELQCAMMFRSEIDLIVSSMESIDYPSEPSRLLYWLNPKNEEGQHQALEQTRAKLAVSFWDKHFLRITAVGSKVCYVIPPNQLSLSSRPMIIPIEGNELVSELIHQYSENERKYDLSLKNEWIRGVLMLLAFALLVAGLKYVGRFL